MAGEDFVGRLGVGGARPVAAARLAELRAIVGEDASDAGLERLILQADGDLSVALELYLASPVAYASDAAALVEDDDGMGAASSIEGVWATTLALLPPEDAEEAHQAYVWRGDRIVLPHAALGAFLDALHARTGRRQPPNPICMRLCLSGASRVCGIADWCAPEGTVIVPQWLLDEMTVASGRVATLGEPVGVESVDVPRATSLSLRPLGQAVRLLSRERQVELLTRGVQDIFTNVRVGDHLEIAGEGGGKFEVVACRGKLDERGGGAGASRGGGGEDARGGTTQEAVCVVAADNGDLEFDLELEESVEREGVRLRFEAAREAYKQTLESATISGRSRLLLDEPSARDQLRALVNAADEAVEAGCEFGEELDLARSGLQAADRLVELERLAREAQAQAEAAREAEAVRLAQEAFQAQAVAEAARQKATALAEQLQARLSALVPAEPEAGGMPIRVQWPHGGQLQRRFEAGATLEQVRAWVVTAYPADAPTPLTEAFVLKTRPVPGTPTIKLDGSNRLLTVEEAGLRGQVLMFDLSGGCP